MRILNDLLVKNSTKEVDLFNNSAILGYIGSISHGTYIKNQTDDKDLMGILMLPKEYIFGLKEFGSRGTKIIQEEEWDVVFYEIRKFISLLSKCNPNVMSLLWLNEDLYINVNKVGEMLIQNRDLFSSKLVYKSYCGYAYSQLKRMNHFSFQGYMGEKRKKLVEKYGYDCKNASHLIRLLRMGIEFLYTGQLNVKRNDADILLDIKKGKWTLDKVKKESDRLFKVMSVAYKESKLPEKPDMGKINNLLIDCYEEYYGIYF